MEMKLVVKGSSEGVDSSRRRDRAGQEKERKSNKGRK